MSPIPGDDSPPTAFSRGLDLLRGLFGSLGRVSPPAETPRRLGRYHVLSLLGEGGMGRVLLGEDKALGRKVALKILKHADESSRRRFLREARAAARVSHPKLCPIFEVGEENGQPFIAMELLEGQTLAARLRDGPLPVEEALHLAEDLLEGLGALHEAGVVHRDVKPSNLFLTPHGLRLVDFGLARELGHDGSGDRGTVTAITKAGLIVGTPGYMSPEQILGHAVDARSDLFAAGVVIYEALTGRRPFSADTTSEASAVALSTTLYEEPAPLTGSPLLVALDAPLRRALAKKPAERYGSARDMADAVRAAARTAEVAAASGATRETFVGRQGELTWLEERFAAAVGGAGSVAFVTGERGVGKSALVGEFLRRVHSRPLQVTIAAGRCAETLGPAEAFSPFFDALGRLLTSPGRDQASALLRTYAPTICVQMPPTLLPDPDGALQRQTAGATKERLIREAADFIEAACRLFPIVLLIEDLHGADQASVELLHHLGCRIARQRTLLLATFRHADVDSGNPALKRCTVDLLARGTARELTLGPLSETELAAYLDARCPGHAFPEALATVLHARSEGLALFVRSLVDILVERGDVARGDGGWALARPLAELDLEPSKGLRDLVRQQLDGLDATEREVLEVATAAGREFLSPVIAHLVHRDEREVEETLRRLAHVRRLIFEAGEETLPDGTLATRYRFAHSLYLSVLREDLVTSRRVELHRRVADRLRHHWGTDAPRIAAAIARQCEEGRDHEGAVAFRAHAGDNAARFFAYAEAEEHYDWAFRWFEKLPAESRPAAALRLHRRRAAVRLAQARFDGATSDYESMLAVARGTGAGASEREALAGLCDTLFFARRVDELSARADELLEVATRTGGPGDIDEARARIGQVLVCQGRLAEAAPLLDQVVASARGRGLRSALKIALAYRSLAHYWRTEYQATETASVEALTVATLLGDGFYALAAQMFLGLARANLGRLSEALDDFTDATAIARRNHDRYWLPRLLSHLGWVHRELGAGDRARACDSEAVKLAQEQPLWGPESEALLNLCIDDVRQGHADRATVLLKELEANMAGTTWLRWVSDLRLTAVAAEHWAARGDHTKADQQAARLVTLAQELGARDYRCAGERMRAEAALARGTALEIESAARRLDEAIEALGGRPAPLEVWKSARMLGKLQRRLGREDLAQAAFVEAAGAIDTIAAGVRDEGLQAGFLNMPAVREVTDACRGRRGASGLPLGALAD